MEVRVKALLDEAVKLLEEMNIVDAQTDSWLLAEHVLGVTRAKYYTNPDMTVSQKDANRYMELVRIRSTKIPLQHITGVQEFMGNEFKVNKDVLIPRQDTELLVEKVCDYIKEQSFDVKVLDMCTGSGCIAISIDKLCNNAEVTASDISGDALAVAMENNRLNKTDVKFVESNLFENINCKYDVIVSNPPYIKTSEIENLMDEVKLHDPMLALDGHEDGLHFYKEIIKKADDYLEKKGMIFFEIGYDQGKSVSKLLEEYDYKNICVLKDLSENDRVVIGRKE